MTGYEVYITPLKARGVYGSETEVTDWLLSEDIGEVTRSIDSTDYDVGVYATDDVTLVFDASDGYLNDETDARSLFRYSRDLAKVRIVFLKDGVPLTTFRGVINEEGSSLDAQNETVTITVMGYESVLRKAMIPKGAVQDGFTFQEAFIAILASSVGGVLNINELNINPVFNGIVDIGTEFDDKAAKDGLDALLLPSNSILLVDSDQNVYVKSRTESANKVLFLHGPGDLLDRENIISISNYNSGLQRTFNLIRVKGAQATVTVTDSDGNDSEVTQPAFIGVDQDGTSISRYGLRIKEVTIDFVTQQTTLDAIATALLTEFAYPKPELEAQVATEFIQAQSPPTDLMDLVSINHPLIYRPAPGKRLPIAGIAKAGDESTPFPYSQGAVVIDMSVAWKVIEIRESPADFTSILKLRVRGNQVADGTFEFLLTEGGLYLETETGELLQA